MEEPGLRTSCTGEAPLCEHGGTQGCLFDGKVLESTVVLTLHKNTMLFEPMEL